MKDKFAQFWDKMPTKQKRGIVLLIVCTLVLLIGYVAYLRALPPGGIAKAVEKKRTVSSDTNLLEKSLYMETRKSLNKTDEAIAALKKEFKNLKEEKTKPANTFENRGLAANKVPAFPLSPVAPPPPPLSVQKQTNLGSTLSSEPKLKTEQVIGGIKVFANPHYKKKAETQNGDSKSDQAVKRTVYLPTGTNVEAFIMTGLDAKTIQSAKGNPQPFLLRIQDLAVLSNAIKDDLEGCFLLANGWGTLDDERVQTQLVNVSCIAKNGHSVIDQEVMGYLADEDSKQGIRGDVVTKMGALTTRAFIAGALGGGGEAVKSSSNTVSLGAGGVTQTLDPNRVGIAALGGGISQSASELQKVYLELIRQTAPVIEMGAAQKVTAVVTQGVLLEIKAYCLGRKKCEG